MMTIDDDDDDSLDFDISISGPSYVGDVVTIESIEHERTYLFQRGIACCAVWSFVFVIFITVILLVSNVKISTG
ncbi:unnamed protein product [Auanema sp. JU1783]|nr:unnamed protein product [Auanema sp. JU1783]